MPASPPMVEVRDFLEKAADRLRSEGYTVELSIDEGEICVFVDGYEVHWRPPLHAGRTPLNS